MTRLLLFCYARSKSAGEPKKKKNKEQKGKKNRLSQNKAHKNCTNVQGNRFWFIFFVPKTTAGRRLDFCEETCVGLVFVYVSFRQLGRWGAVGSFAEFVRGDTEGGGGGGWSGGVVGVRYCCLGGGDVIDGTVFSLFFFLVSDQGIRTRTTIIRCMLTKPAKIRGGGGGGGGMVCGQVLEWIKGGMEEKQKKIELFAR